jgi:hypothetical protein
MQTKFGLESNAIEACLASFLEIPIDNVPNLNRYNDHTLFSRLSIWLKENWNLHPTMIYMGQFYSSSLFIAIGFSLSGHRHAIIQNQNGDIFHNPHPDKIVLTTCSGYLFLTMNPFKDKDQCDAGS